MLNTSAQVFTESAQLDGLGINLSDVGMHYTHNPLPGRVNECNRLIAIGRSNSGVTGSREGCSLYCKKPILRTSSV